MILPGMKTSDTRSILNSIGILILVVGIISAVIIYHAANDQPYDILGYTVEGGSVYATRPDDSRKFLRDLQLYGGKANVIAYEFREWFWGLWYGKSLAYTVAFICVLVSAGFFYAARLFPDNTESDDHLNS